MHYPRLFLTIVISSVTSSVAAITFNVKGIDYNTLADGTVEVEKARDCGAEVTIPESVEYQGKAYQVTAVHDNAFSWIDYIQSVSLPESVTSIGAGAFFNCLSLKKVSIPGKVTEILLDTFAECPMLSDISLPETVTAIGSVAFENCKNLQRLTLPKGLRKMESNCFRGCEKLEEMLLPDDLEVFEERIFAGCSSLQNVHLPNWLTTIPGGTFYGCKSLKEYSFKAPLTTIGELAFADSGLTEVYLPKNITWIEGRTFDGCDITDVWLEHTNYSNEHPYLISETAFDDITRYFATLHVPEGCYAFYYYGKDYWNFENVVETNISGNTYHLLHLYANTNMYDIAVNGQHLWLGEEGHLSVLGGTDIELCLNIDEKHYGEYDYYCDGLSVNGVDRLADLKGDTLIIHNFDAETNVYINFRESGPTVNIYQSENNTVRMILSPDWNHEVTIEASPGYHIKDATDNWQTYKPSASERLLWHFDIGDNNSQLKVNYEKD